MLGSVNVATPVAFRVHFPKCVLACFRRNAVWPVAWAPTDPFFGCGCFRAFQSVDRVAPRVSGTFCEACPSLPTQRFGWLCKSLEVFRTFVLNFYDSSAVEIHFVDREGFSFPRGPKLQGVFQEFRCVFGPKRC